MATRRYYGAAQWKKWIIEQRGSGMTVVDWCDSHGFGTGLYYKWRRKLVAKGELVLDDIPQTTSICAPKKAPAIVQVNIAELSSDATAGGDCVSSRTLLAESILASRIVIEAPSSGCRVFVGKDFSQETLRRVMEVLQ